jgi:hypothetical protein
MDELSWARYASMSMAKYGLKKREKTERERARAK